MLLTAFKINGQVVGTQIQNWYDCAWGTNVPFKAESSVSTGYEDITSITNWHKFGKFTGFNTWQIRNQIIILATNFNSLSNEEKSISVQYLAVSKTNRDSICNLETQKNYAINIQRQAIISKQLNGINQNADIYSQDTGIPIITPEFLNPVVLEFSPSITPSIITSNQDNYSPTGLSSSMRLRLSSDNLRTISGIDATNTNDGKLLVIENINTVANNIKLSDNNASSIASNRFYINGDKVLGKNESCTLIYDGILYRWRMCGRSI